MPKIHLDQSYWEKPKEERKKSKPKTELITNDDLKGHECRVCGDFGTHGHGVSFLRGTPGYWLCALCQELRDEDKDEEPDI